MRVRTPNQIRDESIKCFNQMAPAKYDKGQEEHGGLLDDREDIIADLRGEAIDFWFYVETAAVQMEEKDEHIDTLEAHFKLAVTALELKEEEMELLNGRIEELEKQVKHYKEIAAR